MTVHFGSSVYRFSQPPSQIGEEKDFSAQHQVEDAVTSFPQSFDLAPVSQSSSETSSRFNIWMSNDHGHVTVYDASGQHEIMRLKKETDADGETLNFTVVVDDKQLAKTPFEIGTEDNRQTVNAASIGLFLRSFLSGAGVRWADVKVDTKTYKNLNLHETAIKLRQEAETPATDTRPWWKKIGAN